MSHIAQNFAAIIFGVAVGYLLAACFREPQAKDWKPAVFIVITSTVLLSLATGV